MTHHTRDGLKCGVGNKNGLRASQLVLALVIKRAGGYFKHAGWRDQGEMPNPLVAHPDTLLHFNPPRVNLHHRTDQFTNFISSINALDLFTASRFVGLGLDSLERLLIFDIF